MRDESIICPNCQTSNRGSAYYCKRCQTPLVCPRCRAVLPLEASYCDNCGQPLSLRINQEDFGYPQMVQKRDRTPSASSLLSQEAQKQSPVLIPLQKYIPRELMDKLEVARKRGEMVGERRIVSMLFCDVKGSTAAAEHLDPEDWSEIINGAFEFMIRPVYRYEGTVARLMGDAILAFFGAPIAHEDDPRRAVLAGLDIVAGIQSYREQVGQRWGIELDVRVGINTGIVVVGAVGSDLRMEYTALGDAINLASRMEQTASPGTVQIAHDTYKLIKPLFEFEELGGIEVKGKTEPVPAYRVIKAKATPGRLRGIEGLNAELVGREEEMKALRSVIAGLKQGVGHIVCLIGEAGLGKSRLIEETKQLFQDRIDSSDNWFIANSLSYETGHAYALLRSLAGRITGLASDDPEQIQADKLSALLAGTGLEGEPLASQALQTLMGIQISQGLPALEGETFKRELFRGIRLGLRQRFGDAPVVIVCDDLHWGDAASIELLKHLLPLTEEIPLVFIFSMRPDRESPGWQLRTAADEELHHRYTEIDVSPLSEADSDNLVNRLLAVADLPVALRTRILERASGNPFYVEEVVRNLIESGILVREERSEDGHVQLYWRAVSGDAELDIPDNLQSLLAARIDRLEEDVRRTVQLASVIGRSFYYRILSTLEANTTADPGDLDRQLNVLLRAEMIQQAARIPEPEYRFRNPLTQETAYHTILLKRRRELHRQVAEAIESLFSDRLEENAARLGYHYTVAQEPIKALKYLTMAADNAFRMYAIREAINHYNRAIEIAENANADSQTLNHLYTQLGRSLELDSNYPAALHHYEALESLARSRNDRQLELSAVIAQGTIYSISNDFFNPERGEALAQRGLDLARELKDGAAEAKILWNLLNTYRFTNRSREAQEVGERSLAIAQQLGLREQMAFTLNDLFYAYMTSGQIAKSLQVNEEARKLWRELGNRAMLADNLSSTALVTTYTGDIDTTIANTNEAFEISASIKNLWGIAYSRMNLGTAYWMRGEFDQAIDAMQASNRYGDLSGFVPAQTWSQIELGMIYALLGQNERGLELALPVYEKASPLSLQNAVFTAYLAQIYIAMGDLTKAEAQLKTGLFEQDAEPILKLFLLWSQNALLIAKCEYEQVIQSAESLLQSLYNIGIKLWVPDTLLVLGQARAAMGQTEAARSALKEARAEAEAMGLHWVLWQILAAQARLESQAGHTMEAGELLSQAKEVIQAITKNISDPGLRASFLNRPVVRALFETSKAS